MNEVEAYAPVALDTSRDDESDSSESSDETSNEGIPNAMHPLEMDDDDGEGYVVDERVILFRWSDPWVPSTLVSSFVSLPMLFAICMQLYALVGRTWLFLPFSIHYALSSSSVYYQTHFPNALESRCSRLFVSSAGIVDAVLFGLAYVQIYDLIISNFFMEGDGTPVAGWNIERRRFSAFWNAGLLIVACRIVLAAAAMATRCSITLIRNSRLMRTIDSATETIPARKVKITTALRVLAKVHLCVALSLLIWSTSSAISHFGSWKSPQIKSPHCDVLDETECILPFPSFNHMKQDASSTTGWRVNLRSEVLPRLKGRLEMHPSFLNELDGFSTMAPMLFYIGGLKEAHEAGANQLKGPSEIELSTTSESITLLLDVKDRELVYHSAEIDYLDEANPLVMMFPSRPLKHNTHYAVIVVNATDSTGKRLEPTKGMQLTMGDGSSRRRRQYLTNIIPALEKAAPWVNYTDDPYGVQLIFDFHTISQDSQLGRTRKVRDNVMQTITNRNWRWEDHVRVNNIIEPDDACQYGNSIARIIHGELDVPWFLKHHRGSFHRGSTLDHSAVTSGKANGLWGNKFIIQIPCSVRAGALGEDGGLDVTAIVEYGHGLFGDRFESREGFLLDLAQKNGFVLAAMDWRGMSVYDLLIVVKVLLSRASLFEAVRDNLIQGFAAKFAFQHFLKTKFSSMDWATFTDYSGTRHRLFENPPASVFYGNSQGGILGAGYVGLSGATGLIDRAVLGVPGTPFALIMSRSLDFRTYDSLLLLNYYSNRQVRILLYLTQMAWDSVEGSGVFALPVNEPYPPILMQAGLGDPIVTTIAAEALARALNASVVSNNPRLPFGLTQTTDSDESGDTHVVFTEILYKDEYNSLPKDDFYADENAVHYCLRWDPAINEQIAAFARTGEVIDICKDGGCERKNTREFC